MKIKNLLICLSLLFVASEVAAEPAAMLTYESKEGAKNNLPRNFRDLTEFGINAIASGQFSESELQEVRKKYPTDKIIIVDLRRESHGFINGEAVSWRSPFANSNQGKKVAEILKDENARLQAAKKDQQIIVNKVKDKDRENGWYKEVEPKLVTPAQVTNEETLAKKNGFEYKRFAIRDHARPEEEDLKNMVTFIKSLPPTKKVYVHCAAGRGRTTTFLALFDIIKNGNNADLQVILKRQYKAGGAKLYDPSAEEEWLTKLAQERLEMLKDFYKKEVCSAQNHDERNCAN